MKRKINYNHLCFAHMILKGIWIITVAYFVVFVSASAISDVFLRNITQICHVIK